jgi:hypothetical protein
MRRAGSKRVKRATRFEIRSEPEWDFFVAGEHGPPIREGGPARGSPEVILGELARTVAQLEAVVVRLEAEISEIRGPRLPTI